LALIAALAITPFISANPADAPSPEPAPADQAETIEIPPSMTPVSLVIAVYSTSEGPARVGMVFGRHIPHQELEGRVRKMAEAAGWQIAELRLREESSPGNGAETLASFFCNGIINWDKGILGVEPLVKEFASEGHFRIIFLLPEMENFRGPVGRSEEGLKVEFFLREGAYEYVVTSGQALQEGENSAVNSSADEPAAKKPSLLLLFVIIIIAALTAAGVVIGWLWYGRKKRNP
jgi:hypothetical protein